MPAGLISKKSIQKLNKPLGFEFFRDNHGHELEDLLKIGS